MKDEEGNKLIPLIDHSKCPYCGAKLVHDSNSLHVWENTYECGLRVWGAIGMPHMAVIEDECNTQMPA